MALDPNSHVDPMRHPTPVVCSVPLPIRMALYYISFLGVVLILLPWAASRLDLYVAPLALNLPLWLRIAGSVIFAAAFALYNLSSLHLTTRGRGAYVEFDPPSRFVSSGPFRWCRNPIAAAVVLMIFGEGLALSSGGVLLLAAIGVALAHLQVVAVEEPLLKKRFGQPYEEYLARVPRWLPRPPRERAS
jgi:protein-S-isoprenylcysteine O-methyltransferase Ste14